MSTRRQSKRQRGEASNTSTNEARLNKHREVIEGWTVATERGLTMPLTVGYRKYNAIIRELGWREFTKKPIKPCVPLVREFYSQLHTTETNSVIVFGRTVWFTEEEINKALGTQSFPSPDFYTQLKMGLTDITYQEIEHTLSLGRGLRVSRGTYVMAIGSFAEEARNWRKL